MSTIIPITAISSGLSLFIPLFILYLGGNVFDVGIAFAVYNLVSIPSSLFWGKVTDRYGRVKPFIMLSVIFTFPLLLAFHFFSSLTNAYFYYGIFAIVATASSPAMNILIMGTKRNNSLPKYFSRYSIFSLLGSVTAYFFGYFVATQNLTTYLFILIFLNVISIILAYTLIKDEVRPIEIEKVKKIGSIFPILNTLTSLPNLGISISTLQRIRNTIKNIQKHDVYMLLIAIAFFNLGYYIFNTAYVPYLSANGLTYNNIFLINFSNAIAQIIVFIFIIKIKKGIKPGRVYLTGITYRTLGYFIAAVSVFMPLFFLSINIIAYSIAGFSYAIWNLSSSVILYDLVRGKDEGYFIGIWTGLLGGSAVIGALVSGLFVFTLGYQITFGIAIIATIISGTVFHNSRLVVNKLSKKD
ncbi:MAG: MFS transporter [Candidatus Micrarchaeaceae archaeon]